MRPFNLTTRRPSAAVGIAALALGSFAVVALPASVSAQVAPPDPTATATGVCVEGEGAIVVEISNGGSDEFLVYIDGVFEDYIEDETTGTFGPFDEGTYNVVVEWFEGDDEVLFDDDVTVDCTPDDSTSTTTTTAVSTPDTAPAPAAAAAAAATPRFTG